MRVAALCEYTEGRRAPAIRPADQPIVTANWPARMLALAGDRTSPWMRNRPRSTGMQPPKKKWKDLTPTQRRLAIGGALVQIILLALAQRDLSNRSAKQVRGPKWLWRIVTLVNFVGPLAYFCCGRKTQDSSQEPED